jgi:glutamate formiminotransferase/glutamate formiminotransferase/formiminotetrahydrofolate cyclodeaminase
VLTIAGEPTAVLDAVIAAVRVAVERIDLRTHAGVHPRIGAADVIPFVPVHNTSLGECAELARLASRTLWEDLRVPSFLYEAAAICAERTRLENVRRIARAGAEPDVGEGRHTTAGASAIGARVFLIAWNINLRTPHAAFARQIARSIRESSGGLPAVKALGLPLDSRGESQVSINLVDFRRTPLHVIFEAVEAKCRQCGVEIAGSELIGMIPEAALEASSGYDLHWLNFRPELVLERRLRNLGALK